MKLWFAASMAAALSGCAGAQVTRTSANTMQIDAGAAPACGAAGAAKVAARSALSVVMFKPGDPGFENALDAKQQLGPEWPELVKNGIRTCL